jgi:hypothetical protein
MSFRTRAGCQARSLAGTGGWSFRMPQPQFPFQLVEVAPANTESPAVTKREVNGGSARVKVSVTVSLPRSTKSSRRCL